MMLKKVTSFSFMFCLLLCFITAREPEILFLSTPRSGTHWALYCLCNLLDSNVVMNRGTTQYNILGDTFCENTNKTIFAAHNPKKLRIKKNGYNEDVLILIIRNYREALMRQFEYVDLVLHQIEKQQNNRHLDYDRDLIYQYPSAELINNIRCYDKWNVDNRFLIYYEDLIVNPEAILMEMASFFKVDSGEMKVQDFLNDIERHIAISLKIYEREGGSKSGGKDLYYHSRLIGLENCKLIDEKIEELFPDFFERYLKRYKVTSNTNF